MARPRTPTRFADLVEAATRVFIAAGGYQRAQVADVADALGVAKGTVYLYAESKEALFELALRHADGPPPDEPESLPVATPAPGRIVALLQEKLAARGRFPALAAALEAPAPSAPGEEVERVIGEVFDVFFANRTALRLANAAARDLPELGRLWFDDARTPLHASLSAWIARRVGEGAFAPLPEPAVAARVALESCTWFAVHRHFDPRPDGFDDAAVRATLVAYVRRALVAAP